VTMLPQGLLEAVGEAVPCYVFDLVTLSARTADAVATVDEYFYPLKANPDPRVIDTVLAAGAGLDLCSRGDLQIALRCGVAPQRCSFTSAYLDATLAGALLSAGVAVDLDSPDQVDTWLAVGGADAGLRICTADGASAYGSKFGVASDALTECVARIERGGGRLTTLHLHDVHADRTPDEMADRLIDVLSTTPRDALERCVRVNVGGGWPLPQGLPAPIASATAAFTRLRAWLKSNGFSGALAAEPGEWVVGPSGWLLARVVAVKPHPVIDARVVVVLDAATPVPCRPSRAPFVLVRDGAEVAGDDAPTATCDLYGSANTGLDTIGVGVILPAPRCGDLIASASQGAYARQLTGTFNERPLPQVVTLG
jgi:diaminopimelate decarboxylase